MNKLKTWKALQEPVQKSCLNCLYGDKMYIGHLCQEPEFQYNINVNDRDPGTCNSLGRTPEKWIHKKGSQGERI